MRVLLLFLPVVLMAQGTAPKAPATPSKSTATASKSTRPATKSTAAPSKATPTTLGTDDQKTVYALGLSVYQSLAQFDLSPAELELIKRALSDAAAGKPAINASEWQAKVQTLAQARSARGAEKQKAVSQAYLTKAAAEPGVVNTASGLIYKDLRPGTGASPKATDTVKVNYRGTLTNGTEFDSSYKRNQPAEFPLNQVIPCWTEAVQKMKAGGKARLVCPSAIAYGDGGRPPVIPGGATLVFEIELLDVVSH